MAENNPTHPDLSIPDMRHEHRDVNVWAVGKVGIALILTTIASMGLMFGVFRYLEVREKEAQIPPASTTKLNPNQLPPEPNLLFNEHEATNQQEYRGDEDKLLSGYSWVDQAHGVVRIPIDQAMDLMLKRGVPSTLKAPPAPSTPPSTPAPSTEGAQK